jgi:hypothetical protein
VGIVKILDISDIIADVEDVEHVDVVIDVQITAMMVTKVGRLRPWPTKNWVSTTCECPRIGPKTPLELRKVS